MQALRQTYKYFPQQMEETEGEDIKLLKVQVVCYMQSLSI